MAIIKSPNKDYCGISASVQFVNGVGFTENENLIKWFKEHSYLVEEDNSNTEETLDNEESLDNEETPSKTPDKAKNKTKSKSRNKSEDSKEAKPE